LEHWEVDMGFYKKEGPRLLDSRGIGPLSDVFDAIARAKVSGVGDGSEITAGGWPTSFESDQSPVPKLIAKIPEALPSYVDAKGIYPEANQSLYRPGAVAEKVVVQNPKNADEWIRSMPDADFNALLKEHPHLGSQIAIKDGVRTIIPQRETEAAIGIGPMTRSQEKVYEGMSPAAFKKSFGSVDGPGPAGMGYVELSGGRTEKVSKGTPDFVKVINQPGRGMGGGIDVSGLSPEQATAVAHIAGIGQTAATAKEGHDIEREKLEHLIAQSDIKNPDARVKLLRDIAISGGEKRYILDEDKVKIGEQAVPDYEGAAAIIKAVTGHDLSSSIPKKKVQSALIPPTAAIEFLKKNPKTAAKFDERFGAGASQRYLGG
jgi:hypothetical protein